MKTLLSILALALSFQAAFAQPENYYNRYSEFDSEVKEAYLLADKVNVRSEASSSASVLATLPIGTKVQIVEKTDKYYTSNGYTAPWYKINFTKDNSQQTGMVWGALLSEAVVAAENHTLPSDVQFVWGVESLKSEEIKEKDYTWTKQELKIQVRACKDGKELSKITFMATGGIGMGHYLNVSDNKGVANIKNILVFQFSAESCGGEFGTSYVFWTGTELKFVKTLEEGFDAPYFATEELIFPNDEGGKAGKIILKKETGEYVDDKEEPNYSHRSKKELVWTGSTLK